MKDLLFCRDNNQQQQDCQYDSMQDQTYISVPKSPNFKVTKKYPRTQFSKYRFKNESASVSKRRASKLRLKTARKSRLILTLFVLGGGHIVPPLLRICVYLCKYAYELVEKT